MINATILSGSLPMVRNQKYLAQLYCLYTKDRGLKKYKKTQGHLMFKRAMQY